MPNKIKANNNNYNDKLYNNSINKFFYRFL